MRDMDLEIVSALAEMIPEETETETNDNTREIINPEQETKTRRNKK